LDDVVVPVDWKVANITPIYKNGPKQDPRNYKPFSLNFPSKKIHGTCDKKGTSGTFSRAGTP